MTSMTLPEQQKIDRNWMRQALREAKRAWGRCSPNPMVGAILVKEGLAIGSGYHHQAGTPHAEVHALNQAGPRARGADLYVTLEPCSTQGRTPPCTDAIIAAGIRRVIVGCTDANPAHAGRGLNLLRQAGMEVSEGILAEECRQLNEHFFWWVQQHRPFVTLKMAMTLDGRIALPDGRSKWITGPAARRAVQRLRQLCDAIMVGGTTARTDDPGLQVTDPPEWPCQPQVCIWTTRPLPQELQVQRNPEHPPLLTKPQSRTEWLNFLRYLGGRGCLNLLLEGGGELAASALQAGIVNKVCFFIAPKIIGGRDSRPVVGGQAVPSLAEALNLSATVCRRVGDDFLLEGYCQNVYGNH